MASDRPVGLEFWAVTVGCHSLSGSYFPDRLQPRVKRSETLGNVGFETTKPRRGDRTVGGFCRPSGALCFFVYVSQGLLALLAAPWANIGRPSGAQNQDRAQQPRPQKRERPRFRAGARCESIASVSLAACRGEAPLHGRSSSDDVLRERLRLLDDLDRTTRRGLVLLRVVDAHQFADGREEVLRGRRPLGH